jgi:hypothetical protein
MPPIRRRAILASVAVAAFLPAGGAAAPSWNPFSSTSEEDGKWAQRMEPTPLQLPARSVQHPVRVLRLRFWADHDFRALTPAWKIKVRAWLGQLSRILEPSLGVQLEAESFRTWDRQSSQGQLTEVLDQLTKQDPGADVDWVVGLVSALPLVTTDVHALGTAVPGGKHFVMRAMGDVEDARRVYFNLGKADPAKKEDLYARRIQHKELTIFLHEWAHTFGIPHGGRPDDIMCPRYAPERSRFLPDALAAIDRGVERRLTGETSATASTAAPTPHSAPAPAPVPPVAPAAAQQAAASSWVGRLIDKARAQHQAGDRAGAAATMSDAVDRAKVVAAPGDPLWVRVGEACLDVGAVSAAEEVLTSAGAAPGLSDLRARVAAAKKNRLAPKRKVH